MNAPGALLIVVGAWIVTQILAGNALERLNIVKGDTGGSAGPSIQAPGPYVPGPGGGSGGLPGAGGW